MSNQHVLKIHPAPLADLMSGAKTAEVRRNDRGFQVGDTVALREVNPFNDVWTGRPYPVRTISHIQTGYGLPDGVCVLSYVQPFVPRNREAGRLAIRAALPDVPGDMLDHGLFAALDAMGAQAEQQEAKPQFPLRNPRSAKFQAALEDTFQKFESMTDVELEAVVAAHMPQQETQGAQAWDERAAFEKWAKDRSWFDPRPSTKERDDSLFCYEEAITDHNWIAWQARAALATQPASCEPVAHKLVAVQSNGEWQEVRGKWKDGAPIAEMLEGVKEDYLRVELAFSAPPSATQPAAGEPVAWMIDWPDEPELGHYFSESPDELAGSRSRPLFTAAPPAAAHGDEAVRKDAEYFRFIESCPIRTGVVFSRKAHEPGFDLRAECERVMAMRAQGDGV